MNTSKIYLEHANISVSNLDKGVEFFKTAFPTFQVRGGGNSELGEWLHLGDDTTYLALTQGEAKATNNHPNYNVNGINHIGFVVDDVEGIAQRLQAAGYKRSYPKQVQEFRIRDYFDDSDGNQYEFVQYLSEVASERNSYTD